MILRWGLLLSANYCPNEKWLKKKKGQKMGLKSIKFLEESENRWYLVQEERRKHLPNDLLSHWTVLFWYETAFTCPTVAPRGQRQPEAALGVGEETNNFAQVHFITVGFSETRVASASAMIRSYMWVIENTAWSEKFLMQHLPPCISPAPFRANRGAADETWPPAWQWGLEHTVQLITRDWYEAFFPLL